MNRHGSSKRAPAHARRASVPNLWRGGLRDAILSRVVPRLADASEPAQGVAEAGVMALAEAALTGPVSGLIDEVERRRAGGMSVEALLLNLVTPAARRLGDLWIDDRISFIDVTAGLGRLQALVRALGPALDEGARRAAAGRRILLAPVPGEQHVFGLSIVAALFRRGGWEVTLEPRIAFDDLLTLVGAERFTVIGLSAAGDDFLDALPEQVAALRRATGDRGVAVLGGGPSFLLDPGLGARVGVDAAPRDAAEALRAADWLAERVSV